MDRAALVTEPDAETATARTSTFKSGRRPGIELITRAEPRRRWSVEQKQSIAAESLVPGASPTEVARRHGISSGLLYAWRKALLAAQPSIARFARVEVAPSAKPANPAPNALSLPLPAPAAGTIEIVLPNRTTIRVDAQIDPRALRRVLSVLVKQ
jgi:transposase